ncbi:hypothetical protein Lalb_Chr21g0313581 [Lupinus albus]|uniref:STICHEL DnaA-N-like alpha-beta domain-containing protein n=1 Tax=Lupinus albus TaxID=3870 RepID=A0A6A4NTF4_LUPAL|nr:hypothetical protein Lalb_Chr21g0313581 [Lupinus albus]
MFSSQLTKSTAEKFTGHILQAFESVLRLSITIEIRCETNKDVCAVQQSPILPGINNNSPQIIDSNNVAIQGHPSVQRNGWSKRKAVSIAEKLEQENLRLEPKSRSLLCWKASRATRRKLLRLKIRARKPCALLKLVSCGKCLSTKSPR